MKRAFLILTVLTITAALLVPETAQARVTWNPGPYQPAPAASYPSTPQIDASMPVTKLAPILHERIRQTPEEGRVDPLGDSKTPMGPSSEAGEARVAEEVAEKIVREEEPRESFETAENAEPAPADPSRENSEIRSRRSEAQAAAPATIGGCSLVR